MNLKTITTMEKLYEVRVDITVTKSLYTSAASAEEAERIIKEKLDADPYYDAKTMDSVLDYEIVEVSESEDDDAEDGKTENNETTLDKAIRYVRDNMDEDDMAILHAEMNKCYKMHLIPDNDTMDCSKVIDLLEEYGQENDLPEGWWESECEIDEILVKL